MKSWKRSLEQHSPTGIIFLTKNVESLERRYQLMWFLERLLLLVKINYMSKLNYSYIFALKMELESVVGKYFAYVIDHAARQKKVNKTSKLAPILCALFIKAT